MFTDKIVNAKMQRYGQLVRCEVFAVAKAFTLKPLQFLPNGQERTLYVARSKTF
jgi:hypothetical protein